MSRSVSGSVSLFCIIHGGQDEAPFPVRVNIGDTIGELKKLIKAENANYFKDIDAHRLKLWKWNQPGDAGRVKVVELDINNALNPMKKITSIFEDDPPKEESIHIIVKTYQPVLKRENEDTEPDSVLERWQSKRPKYTGAKLPSIFELASLINQPLSQEEKMPIPNSKIRQLITYELDADSCQEKDVELLFRNGTPSDLSGKIFYTVYTAPPISGTESLFHHFWDSNVRDILELLIPGGKSIRDSSVDTATRNLRPDYGFLMNNLCIFRGEEKCPSNRSDPKKELIEKLVWVYDPAPYVFGYYAAGAAFTLVAISPPLRLGEKPCVHDIAHVNLSRRKDRIKNICHLINLFGLFNPITDIVKIHDAEFQLLERDYCTVEIAGRSVIKRYTSHDRLQRVDRLEKMYNLLKHKNVPNVDSLQATTHDAGVVLVPRGIAEYPKTETELLEAIVCVLQALKVLHAPPGPPVFHRDIRWPNVIRSLDEPQKWFIIDWEDAAVPPTKAERHFSSKTHSPRIFQDNHGAEVDLWGVGGLIVSCKSEILGISKELIQLGEWMQCETPSAEYALQRITDYQSSL